MSSTFILGFINVCGNRIILLVDENGASNCRNIFPLLYETFLKGLF